MEWYTISRHLREEWKKRDTFKRQNLSTVGTWCGISNVRCKMKHVWRIFTYCSGCRNGRDTASDTAVLTSPPSSLNCHTYTHVFISVLWLISFMNLNLVTRDVTQSVLEILVGEFVTALTKLRKATTSFVMSCLHGITRLQLDGFSLNFVLECL